MQTLKIEIPNGFEIDSFDKLSGEIRFKEKPKAVTERIKTVEDVFDDHRVIEKRFYEMCDGLDKDEVAYRILKLVAKSLNEGWTPDWNNPNEYKYFPWFDMRGSSGFRFDGCDGWNTDSVVGSRLCFKTRELAEHAGKHFENLYKQFMVIE